MTHARPIRTLLALATTLCLSAPLLAAEPQSADGTLPTDANGRSLNFDFEAGTLKDWTAEGAAFARQPIDGDAVARRRSDMKSQHAGRYWIGTFEGAGDDVQGTLTSVPFKVTKPWASFLIAGGSKPTTRVEIVRKDTGDVVQRVSGDDTENLKRVAVDLTPHLQQEIFIRLVDQATGGWGHINFDDFRLHATKPNVPQGASAASPDVYAHAGLSPEEAAKAMTLPEGFKVTLFAGEPDVVQPIAFAIDDRGRIWVAEAYSYPHRVPADQAKDRILIFEDTDGDGKFDKRKVFADKLNLVSGLEVGFGGVWVGAAPELLFIPDKDGDDTPDGPPQVLLDGWGQHDTHETLNSFNWGPDGWLYGCHGVFTHSRVGKPGTPDDTRIPINAGIWRYHPTKHIFEVFAHGTSNPWGVDFDDHGQAFLTSCVIPHLYHVIQNGRYERQAGQHFNPYTYDDIKTIADHRHYVGANPHGGNGRSDSAGGGHAHAGAMIYLGDKWPKEYRGSIFMNNIHGARLNRDAFTPKGSGFVGSHAPDFLLANDSWSQIVSLKLGPDGSIFMIDWYDKNQCHRVENEMHDRTNGRIFKVSYRDPSSTEKAKPVGVDLRALSDDKLRDLLFERNDWYVRHARRILQERAASGELKAPEVLRKQLRGTAFPAAAFTTPRESTRLRALWMLHAVGGFTDEVAQSPSLQAPPYLRAWTIQLLMENKNPASTTLTTFAELAKSDPSPVVRLYLASALQRLPLEKRWDIIAGLLRHFEDDSDPNLPLMYWYAAEPLAEADTARAAKLAADSKVGIILPYMTRRIGAIGSPEAIALLVDEIGRAGSPEARTTILKNLLESLKGRRRVDMPAAWPALSKRLMAEGDAQIQTDVTALGLTFGDPAALATMRRTLTEASRPLGSRREALAALLKARDPELAGTLQRLVDDASLRGDALRGLAAYDDPKTPGIIVRQYRDLTPSERRDALSTLTSRVDYAKALLAAVAKKEVTSKDLSADLVRSMRNLGNKDLNDQIVKVWGSVRDTSEDAAKRIARYKAVIGRSYSQPRDLNLGRAVFAKTCGQCHTLFGAGGKVGPEITGSNRADLDYLLSNVLDPSALIGNDYVAQVVATTDGRVLTGLIKAEDKDAITLVTANETFTIPKSEIEERKPSDKSMMPDDLLTPLSDHEIRSLVAYLASPNQVPTLATVDNAATIFNGKDLTGWSGDAKLWTVQDGEIVGRTSGLARNEFLRSDLTADDFRLTVRVKLVNNAGNSGIQFRSEALPDGEMRGDQADVGVGWWGRLYEENGRGLIWKESGEAHVKSGEWNTYEIVAVGTKIRTFLNGHKCADLDDPAGARRGIFALQLHSGGQTEVRFKDFKLEVNPKDVK